MQVNRGRLKTLAKLASWLLAELLMATLITVFAYQTIAKGRHWTEVLCAVPIAILMGCVAGSVRNRYHDCLLDGPPVERNILNLISAVGFTFGIPALSLMILVTAAPVFQEIYRVICG